jgi:hypothetical protein
MTQHGEQNVLPEEPDAGNLHVRVCGGIPVRATALAGCLPGGELTTLDTIF